MTRKRIVFVGETPAFLAEIGTLLEPQNNGQYIVHAAATGRQALEMMEKEKIDMVFSRQEMPDEDGLNFLAAVAQKFPLTYRVVLTERPEVYRSLSRAGVVHQVLASPCTGQTIATLLFSQQSDEAGEKRLKVRQGKSEKRDADEAVRELAEQIGQPNMRVCLVFFSDGYDPLDLGRALKKHLPGPVIGCSTAGQLTEAGFLRGGISGASLAGDEIAATPYLIRPLSSQAEQVKEIAEDVQEKLSLSGLSAFGFLLVDGLSMKEELLISSLYMSFGDVPIVGGSAGDSLQFKQTFVYYDGELLRDAAVLTLFQTSLPFRVFKHQHFKPTSMKLVVTDSDPVRRLVKEFNGEPAAEAYAELIGTTVERLDSSVFSRFPLMLRIGDDYYVRSISSVEPDGGLKLFCAIDTGLVLTIGQGDSAFEALADDLLKIRRDMGEPAIIIGCDCILRRLEMEEQQIDDKVGRLLAGSRVIGFSTYGEQYNSVHINQTFTGIAIAG
jgi:hypothetical protein